MKSMMVAQNTVNDGRLTHVRAANNRHYRISETLDTVGDFTKYRGAVDTADLLEVGELGYFHAVEPNCEERGAHCINR